MLRIRQAVRAVLLTPASDVLLVRFEFPLRTVWALPGGGVEPDEDDLTALHRELGEELGLTDVELGPHVWSREHIIPHEDGLWDGQRDRFYLAPVGERFEPRPTLSWDELRAERLHEIRWWSLTEIEADDATWFAPRRLGPLLRALVDEGPPAHPVETGV
jgi:8-oxo-dGTP diphosphatase